MSELGLLLSRDPEEDQAFREAEGEGSPQAWRAFLDLFPEGIRAAEARSCLTASVALAAELPIESHGSSLPWEAKSSPLFEVTTTDSGRCF